MLPIIFTTPRTGSTLVGKIISNYFIQHFDHGPYLDEFFTIHKLWSEIHIKNKWIERKNFSRYDIDGCIKYNDDYVTLEINKRLKLLLENENHFKQLIKLFSFNLNNELLKFIEEKYNFFILLERKNKINQFLSFNVLLTNNKAHYTDNNLKINYIEYKKDYLTQFLHMIKLYNAYKESFIQKNYKIIYYEDLFSDNNTELNTLNMLGLKINKNFKPLNYRTIPTPYTQNIENLIINKSEWYNDKEKLLVL